MSLTDPIKFNIIDARFETNSGASGGAVSVVSTLGTAGGFERCRFDGNDATDGGALYLSTGDTDDTDNPRFVLGSVFLHNVAGESSLTNE